MYCICHTLTFVAPKPVSTESLRIGRNQLEGEIPNEFGHLTELKTMHLGGNQVVGTIPTEIGLMQAMGQIIFKDNFLTGNVPSEIAELSELTRLELQRNDLVGEIPDEFCGIKFDNFLFDCEEIECSCCKNQNCD